MHKSRFSAPTASLAAIGIAFTTATAAEPSTLDAADSPAPPAKPVRNIDGTRDNSFLVEEAYNQEAGVVQHILNAGVGFNEFRHPGRPTWNFLFTEEWPLFSQKHQFSYAIPYFVEEVNGSVQGGLGDIFLNYRYQLLFEEKSLTALAPRFSLVLPTGDPSRGFSSDTLGYQWALPFSTTAGDSWFFHANAGLSFFPNAGPPPRQDLIVYNLGASAVYALSADWNLMLEWVGVWNESSNGGGGTTREWLSVISPGVRRAFNFSGGSQLVVGLAAPIGVSAAAPEFGIFFYLSFEHRFMKSTR